MINDCATFLNEIPQSEGFRRELLQKALALQQELLQEESDDPLVRMRNGQAWRRIGEIYHLLGDEDRAESALLAAEDCLALDRDETAQLEKLAELGAIDGLLSVIHVEQNLRRGRNRAGSPCR